jgi:hypothetical protein
MKADLRERLIDQASTAALRGIDEIERRLADDGIPEGSAIELNAELKTMVAGLTGTAERLLDAEDPRDAEVLITPILRSIKGESERERIEAALARFEHGRTPTFNAALARWLSHRSTPVFVQFAPKLDPEALEKGAATELGEVLARLWLEADEEEVEEARKGLALIGELRQKGALVQLGRLTDNVRDSFSGVVTDEGELERQRNRLSLLEEMVRIDLIAAAKAADVVIGFAVRTLAEQPVEGQEGAIAGFLQACFAFAADDASPALLKTTRDALAESPWIGSQSPQVETIHLQIEGGLARGENSARSPFAPGEIAELARSHGSQFIPGAVLWLERFGPTPGQVAKGLDPMLRGVLPAPLAAGVSAYSERQSPLGRYRLVRRIVEWPSARNPPRSLLRALGIQGADPEKVTAAIVERFTRARNNTQRQAALNIWRAFAPKDDASRRTLIREVFIPLSRQGLGGYRLARKYLDLCENPPRGTKGKLIEALENAPRRKEGRSMHRRMEQVGLKSRKGK